ncbi:glycoside hydrolase family 3 protein [Streptomyces hirsutus]
MTVTRTGPAAPVTGPRVRATCHPAAGIAVGDETPWGVGAELERLLPGTTTGVLTGPDAGARALEAAAGRRVVAVVRDEHRHPWMRTALDTLLAAGPGRRGRGDGRTASAPEWRAAVASTARRACAGPRRRRRSSRADTPADPGPWRW